MGTQAFRAHSNVAATVGIFRATRGLPWSGLGRIGASSASAGLVGSIIAIHTDDGSLKCVMIPTLRKWPACSLDASGQSPSKDQPGRRMTSWVHKAVFPNLCEKQWRSHRELEIVNVIFHMNVHRAEATISAGDSHSYGGVGPVVVVR